MERELDEIEILHLHEGGPVEAVWEWVTALHSGRFGDLWARMSPTWRMLLIEEWMLEHRAEEWMQELDLIELPHQLMDLTARTSMRIRFGEAVLTRYRRCFGHGFRGWGAASHPRLVALDHEQVLLVDPQVRRRAGRREHDRDGRLVVPRGRGQVFDLTYADDRWWVDEPVNIRRP